MRVSRVAFADRAWETEVREIAQLQQTTEEMPVPVKPSIPEPTTRPDTPFPEPLEIGILFSPTPRRKFLRALEGLRHSQEPPTDAEFAQIMAKLREDSERSRPERVYASWLLGRLPLTETQRSQAIPLLCDILLDEKPSLERRFQRRVAGVYRRCDMWFKAVAIYAGVLCLAIFVSRLGTPFELAAFLLSALPSIALSIAVPLLIGLMLLSFFGFRNQPEEVRTMAVKTLAKLQAVEATGAIAETLCVAIDAVSDFIAGKDAARKIHAYRECAYAGLNALFPLLTERHYGQLGAQFTPRLCNFLAWTSDSSLLCAGLEALGKAGDGRAVESVQWLSKHSNPMVRACAERILPVLQQRRELERSQATLLRASQAPPVPSEELLRPAPTGSLTPETELLHPIEKIAPDA